MTESAWEEIIEGLRSSDASIAASAAERLHKQASSVDLHRLLELLGDDDAFLREAAAWPISALAGPSYLHELLIAYQRGFDDGLDNDGFTTALIDLAAGNPLECREALLRLTRSESATLRESATWLLEFCQP
jgi:HEAT repeat protein